MFNAGLRARALADELNLWDDSETQLTPWNGKKPGQPSSATSPLVRAKEAAELLTSASILRRCVEAKWLKQCIQRKRLTIYKRMDVMACVW
jgi:hypothetical protein